MLNDRKFAELTKLIEQLKLYAPAYVKELGITHGDPEHMISCLVPGHVDNNPSMGWYREGRTYHCFSCDESYDIFRIAHQYEEKPIMGKEFIKENVFYLAEKFNVPYEHINIEFTPEDLEKFKQYDIMKIVTNHVMKNINKEYLEERDITTEASQKLKIGSANWEELEAELKEKEFDQEDYQKLGVNKRNLNGNKLVFIIKDNHGRPVSFVSREMKLTEKAIANEIAEIDFSGMVFETKKAKTDFILEKLGPSAEPYLKTPKYINGIASLIYNKSEVLFGYSDVKEKISRLTNLFIVEGYMDFVTAYQNGFYNVVALGSASFTDQHTDFLEESYYVRKVAIALDQDETGNKRTETLIERLKLQTNLSNKYSVAQYKTSGKDLDEIIRTTNPQTLEDVFEVKTLFEYTIENLINKDSDDQTIVELVLPTIMQEESHLKKAEMAKQLASYTTTYSSDTIIRELNYREDIEKKGIAKKYDKLFEKYKNEVLMDPKNINVLLDHLKEDAENIHNDVYQKEENIFENTLRSLRNFEEASTDQNSEIKTGFKIFDQTRLISPSVFSICGRANSFKTTLFENSAINIIKNNPNAMVFFYSTDDPTSKIINDFIANIAGIPREYVLNPLKHPVWGLEVSSRPEAIDIYQQYLNAIQTLETWIKEKRLIIQHVTDLPTWNNYENALKKLSEDKDLTNIFKVSIIDSLNKVECGIHDSNPRIEFLSEQVKKAAERYNFLILQNVELKKIPDFYKVGLQDLRGSVRLEYDPSVIITGNNNFHNLKSNTDLKFVNEFDEVCPIITLEVEKTKLGGEKYIKHFYKIDGTVNRMIEIPIGSQMYNDAMDCWQEDTNRYTNLNGGGF